MNTKFPRNFIGCWIICNDCEYVIKDATEVHGCKNDSIHRCYSHYVIVVMRGDLCPKCPCSDRIIPERPGHRCESNIHTFLERIKKWKR